MATVSDELVERVAAAMANGKRVTFHERAYARAAIAALSAPEFVLPLAEEMLRGANIETVKVYFNCVTMKAREKGDACMLLSENTMSLIDHYRAVMAE